MQAYVYTYTYTFTHTHTHTWQAWCPSPLSSLISSSCVIASWNSEHQNVHPSLLYPWWILVNGLRQLHKILDEEHLQGVINFPFRCWNLKLDKYNSGNCPFYLFKYLNFKLVYSIYLFILRSSLSGRTKEINTIKFSIPFIFLCLSEAYA